jgi:hypothetical protein
MIPEMFHVKHFRPIPAQNLTRCKTAGALVEIRPGKILVRLKSRGGPARNAPPRQKNAPKCKIGFFVVALHKEKEERRFAFARRA